MKLKKAKLDDTNDKQSEKIDQNLQRKKKIKIIQNNSVNIIKSTTTTPVYSIQDTVDRMQIMDI